MAANDVLFVHNNFPGQFGFLADALAARGMRVAVIGSRTAKSAAYPVQRWNIPRGSTPNIFPPATRAEADLLRAHAAVDRAVAFRKQGFNPELIIGHPGWGETLLLDQVWPGAKQILHGEFYYHPHGADVGFDPEFSPKPSLAESLRIASKNATMALAYAQARAVVAPTPFQASVLPPGIRPITHIIHEGVDTDAIGPDLQTRLPLPGGRVLDRSTPVVTFINRKFEPLRGFHIFMRALPRLLQEAPEVQVVLIGSDGKGYGGDAPGEGWRQTLMAEVGGRLDMSRVHFIGQVEHKRMLTALSVSTAHVYYTYPFVLSWSLLEAMASECLIIGSDTAPMRDAVEHGENGLLLDFFDIDALTNALLDAVRRPRDFDAMRQAARRTVVERFDRKRICLPAWLELIDRVRAEP